jgi:hypothetical protein
LLQSFAEKEVYMSLFRIPNWDDNFEVNRTRELKRLDWVPLPNKLDDDGYTELVDHPNGAAHLGAWMALLAIASKCKPRRGVLLRENGTPHDAHSLARISRLPASVFEEVIPRLISIGWLEAVPFTAGEETDTSQESAAKSQGGAARPQDGAARPQEGAPSRARAQGMEGRVRSGGTHTARSAPDPGRARGASAGVSVSRKSEFDHTERRAYALAHSSTIEKPDQWLWSRGAREGDFDDAIREWIARDRPGEGTASTANPSDASACPDCHGTNSVFDDPRDANTHRRCKHPRLASHPVPAVPVATNLAARVAS